MKPARTGKKTNQRLKAQKTHFHQLDFLFKMQCVPRASEGTRKIQRNYRVGEKAVRLKDEGPAPSLQRDRSCPGLISSLAAEEKKGKSQSLPKLHTGSRITMAFLRYITFIPISHKIFNNSSVSEIGSCLLLSK